MPKCRVLILLLPLAMHACEPGTRVTVVPGVDGALSTQPAPSATITEQVTDGAMASTPAARTPMATLGVAPPLGPVEPSVVTLCPEHPEVPFEALALNDGLRLVVRLTSDVEGSGALLVSPGDSLPHTVPNSDIKRGVPLSGYGPSPSGRWLELDYTDAEGGATVVWWSSLDGEDQWEVMSIARGEYYESVSDEEIVVMDVPAETPLLGEFPWDEYAPVRSVNPITGETRQLAALPMGAIFEYYFTQGGHSYAVFRTREWPTARYYLFDYSDGTSTAAFPWLIDVEGPLTAIPGGTRSRNGLFTVVVERPYGFDLAFDLGLDDIVRGLRYDQIMTPVHLPGEHSLDIATHVDEASTEGALPVLRFERDGRSGLTELYMYDYQDQLLTNYCLGGVLNQEHTISGALLASPDGRFLATTLAEITNGELPTFEDREVLVIDTESGHYARIEGVGIIGWAVAPGGSPTRD